MNLIVHNVTEPTDEEDLNRKKHDIDFVTSTFQQYLGVRVTINKAFRLGKHSDKPRLLKISVNSEAEKASLLRNATKLKNVDHPEEIQHIFIFNLPNIDWDNLFVTSYNYPLQLCDIMLDFVADSG